MEWSNKNVRVGYGLWFVLGLGLGLGFGLGLGCSCLVFVSRPFSSVLVVFAKESVADVFSNE